MTPLEAVTLCRFAKACCPQQAIDEYTPDAWGMLLEDVPLDDAMEAVKLVCRRRPFISPAEIIEEIEEIHRASRRRVVECQPPASVPSEAWMWWTRRIRENAVDHRDLGVPELVDLTTRDFHAEDARQLAESRRAEDTEEAAK